MKILVVEDEHKIANSIKKGLEQEGYLVDVVYDGQDGLDYALSESYDGVILDRLLPHLDGVSICKILRTKQVHVPILLLTAKGQVDDRVEGLNAGADDYLVKPFAFAELLARVKAITRRPPITTSNIATCDTLSVNFSTYEVMRGQRRITLSQKEFAILAYLLRHKGKTVTKEQIIDNIWQYDATVLPNAVEVYVKRLRQKIDTTTGEKPIIYTVRGFGYQLKD